MGILEIVVTDDETIRALLDVEAELLQAHRGLVNDPRYDVEGLDRASCAGHITALARLAFGAWSEGVSAQEWRSWILDTLGDRGATVLGAAEGCMHANGLWPWRE
ncbi:hypothetical protein [Leekyejoonella antrihumi]|uniref:Uncharacterized protein n=1 Tax=Leekyejoonella antrihumi TaxID=1660198 RepID=A0A563E0R9_9MICO|nr:hypothetical protein [Leekyejoonella antrihumi]TWP35823.1 hypothetical protein FGL98_12505 [Leekyejoonella antrihumi]